jgi:hypothetical protein
MGDKDAYSFSAVEKSLLLDSTTPAILNFLNLSNFFFGECDESSLRKSPRLPFSLKNVFARTTKGGSLLSAHVNSSNLSIF